MTDEQTRVIVETLNTATVAIQEIAAKCWSELGLAESDRIRTKAGEANRELFEAFPEFKAPVSE